MPDEEICPECHGARWKTSGEKARTCLCLLTEMLSGYLGPDLNSAPKITYGPLYALDENFNTKLDRTSENLFIKSTWPVFLPHLRLAIGYSWYNDSAFRYLILTDERILNVFVGNEQYNNRSRKSRENKDSYNGLKDLVEGSNLIIVRLGFLGYKNAAAPGALKQALMIREVARKPTWIVRSPEDEYPRSWNDEVALYVKEYFDTVDLSTTTPRTLAEDPSPSMNVEHYEAPTPSRGKTKKAAPPPEEPSLDLGLMPTEEQDPFGVTRVGKYKAGSKRSWKKPKAGGGAFGV